MSLIVARKDDASILIVSDTHLSYADAKAVGVGQKRHPSTGVIKTVIINNDISVSFAGGEVSADEAFQRIESDAPLARIKSILLQVHLECRQATDFIIAVGSPEFQIFEIKNSDCLEVEAAWIGSKKAFSAFQEFMQGNVKRQSGNYMSFEPVVVETQTKLFGTMASAMDYVIENDSIPEVDGFRVNTVFTEGKFQYTSYVHSYMSDRPLIIEIPEGVSSLSFPITHGTAENGGYTINFFRSSNFMYSGIHILQGNFGIIYERTDNGLLRPTIIPNMDEVDFIDYAEDNFGISPSGHTQDRERKCILAGDGLLKEKDYIGALALYDKALRHCYGKKRAIFYYRKAVVYADLGQLQEVIQLLSEATKSDSAYQKTAFSLVCSLIEKIRRERSN